MVVEHAMDASVVLVEIRTDDQFEVLNNKHPNIIRLESIREAIKLSLDWLAVGGKVVYRKKEVLMKILAYQSVYITGSVFTFWYSSHWRVCND